MNDISFDKLIKSISVLIAIAVVIYVMIQNISSQITPDVVDNVTELKGTIESVIEDPDSIEELSDEEKELFEIIQSFDF